MPQIVDLESLPRIGGRVPVSGANFAVLIRTVQPTVIAQKFMHGIRVLMAKNYIDNLSEEVKKGLHTKASQNLWPSFAPPGYRNIVSEDENELSWRIRFWDRS